MSLISQRDKEVAISALENYMLKLRVETPFDTQNIMEVNALLNWVKLDYQKNISS